MGAVMTIKAHGAKGATLGGLLGHCSRDTHQQEMIVRGKSRAKYDPERSHLNYDLAADDGKTAPGIMRLATLSTDMYVNPGPTTNIAASWVWTMPEEYLQQLQYYPPEEAKKKTKEFFVAIKEFLDERYCGADCVLSASVHLDEYSPHMHYVFVPRVKNPKAAKDPAAPHYKVASSSMLHKKDLYAIHPELEAYLCKRLGVAHVGMKKEATEEQYEQSNMAHGEYMRTMREAEQRRIDFFQQVVSDFELRTKRMRETYCRESAQIAISETDAKKVQQVVEEIKTRAQDAVIERVEIAPGFWGQKKKKKQLPGKVLEQADYERLVYTASRAAGASYDAQSTKSALADAERRAKDAEEQSLRAGAAQRALMRLVEALAEKADLKYAVKRMLAMAAEPDDRADLQAEAERVVATLKPKTDRAGERRRQHQTMKQTYLGR